MKTHAGTRAPRDPSAATTLAAINDELRRIADDLPHRMDPNPAIVEHRLKELGESLDILRHRMDWLRWRTYHDRRLARVMRSA